MSATWRRQAWLVLLAAALATGCGQASPDASDGGGAQVAHAGTGGDLGAAGMHGTLADGGGGAYDVAITSSTTTVCPGQCVDLTATASGGDAPYTFHWDHQLGDAMHAQRACPTETTRYMVTVDDAAQDGEFAHDHVPVSASVEITVAEQSACHDGQLSDAGTVEPGSLEQCSFRAHLAGGGFTEDQAQKQHQSFVDGHGNLLLSGSFSGTLDVDGTMLSAGGQLAGYVIKLDPSCHVLWAKGFASEANSSLWIAAVASGKDDHVYVGGGFSGKTVLGDSTSDNGAGYDGFVLQLDGDGNMGWSHVYESNYAAVAVTDLVSDAQQRITFVGYAGFDTNLGGGPLSLLYAASMPFIAQLGADGAFGWGHTFTDPDLLFGLSPSMHDDGFVLTGWASSSVSLGSGALSLGHGGRFLAKLDANGQAQWTHALPHGADVDQWNWWKGGLAVTAAGQIVVLRDEPETLPGDSGDRVLDDSVEQYTADGTPVWQTRLSAASHWEHEWGSALTLFSDAHPLRFGSFIMETAYAGQPLRSRGGSDVALVELSAGGEALWTYAMGAELDDRALSVAVTADDEMFASYGSVTDASGLEQDLVVVKLRRP